MPNKKTKRKKSAKAQSGAVFIMKKIATASLVGLALFFILIAIMSFFCYKGDADPGIYKIIIIAVSAICGFVCGFAAVLPVKHNGLVIGFLSVLPMYFLIFAAVTILNKQVIGSVGWAALGAMAVAGGVAGVFAANKTKKRKI